MDSIANFPMTDLLFTHLLVNKVRQQREDEGPRAKAHDTPFRNSDAGKCARLLGLKLAGVPDSNPFDFASDWVTWLGKMVHDHFQQAVMELFPEAEAEVKCELMGITSGHLDLMLTFQGHKVCYELKTVNGFRYSKAIGIDKAHYRRVRAEGPVSSHLIQGSLNALAVDADLLVIGYIAMEAISKQCAEKTGLGEMDRIITEWSYIPEEFTPIAEAELDRMARIRELVEEDNLLPAGTALIDGETSDHQFISPHRDRLHWACAYCSHLDVCRTYPDGLVELRTSVPDARENEG